ncbi:MAG: asparagine synthase (glutamine-hydrolyzing) [Planctomycetota bacterium]
MCGIYGVLALKPGARPDPALLSRMGAVTRHRGPDDDGVYADQHVLLGMRRLSIIDLSGGHQPIGNEDGQIQVVCNGEIYNFRELREELKRRGHVFKTGSDTEVLVHLYEEEGDAFVGRLNGMFGFALWDARRRRLLVGRDPVGIKPIYYALDGQRLAFASEAKALLEMDGMTPAVDHAALADYLAYGYVPAPRSMFQGIRKLPVASLLVCEQGTVSVRRYWEVPRPEERLSSAEWIGRVRESLERAVVSQMVSDVPLGAFLSGGIDSSAVVAFMARHSSAPVKTYSIGFEGSAAEGYYNELPYARQVASRFGTDHRDIVVKPDVAGLLPRLLWHMDEPIADTAFLTTYLVSEFARRDVTVILSGVGGDELFGGYRRYLGAYYDRYARLLPRWFRTRVLAPLARRLPADRHSALLNLSRHVRTYLLSQEFAFEDRYRFYMQVFKPEAREALVATPLLDGEDPLARAFAGAGEGDALYRLFRCDLETQLPDDLLLLTDKMTMATSLECRVPLLDLELVDLSARMPSSLKVRGRELKHVLKRALRGILPDEILSRKKRGFGAPFGAWLKRELAPLLGQVLSRESVERRGLFRWETIARTIADHNANREDYTDHLLALLNFEIWCRLYLDGTPHEAVAAGLAAESLS